MSSNDLSIFKLLLIGDSGVGKSSLLSRYVNDAFDAHLLSTIGIDFKVKTVELDGKKLKLQIWDTAGQERFRHITSNYYRGAQGIAFIFSLTDNATFNNLTYWITEVKKKLDTTSGLKMILIGTKADALDLHPHENVSQKHLQNFIKSHNMTYIETSAKTGLNVDTAFETIARQLLETKVKSVVTSINEMKPIQLDKLNVSRKSKCC